jgi:Asp-tRNA(Asn)/Glu-tRNA(Gln) amidotransferase A subunit family amidase
VFVAVEKVAKAVGAARRVTIPENDRARAAAMIITASEGASLHLEDLKNRPMDFDPMTRDRFLAGALVPAAHYVRAQRFRAWYRERVREIFRDVDVLLAPTTPFPAPLIGQETIAVAGVQVPTRPMLGLYTQPLSFIGLPVISVPVAGPTPLPLGVQLVAAPWNEAALFRVAAVLERDGVAAARIAG